MDHMFRDGGNRLVCTAHGVSALAFAEITGKFTFHTEIHFWRFHLQASCLPSFNNCTIMLYLMIENTLVRTYMATVLVQFVKIQISNKFSMC